MNIIIVMRSWSYRGGEKIMLNLASSLARHSHKVTVIAGRKEDKFQKKDKGFEIIYPKKLNKIFQNNLLSYSLGSLYFYYEIRKRIKDTDLVLTEFDACLNGSYFALLGTKIKLVWYVFDYDRIRYQNKLLQRFWDMTQGNLERLMINRVNKTVVLSESVKKIVEEKYNIKTNVLYPIIKI